MLVAVIGFAFIHGTRERRLTKKAHLRRARGDVQIETDDHARCQVQRMVRGRLLTTVVIGFEKACVVYLRMHNWRHDHH